VVRRLGHAILIGRNYLTEIDTTLWRKLWLYGLWVGVTSLLLTYPLLDVVRFGLSDGDASHIFIVPLLSAATLWLDRRAIFQSLAHDYFVGISFAVAGVATLALTHEWMGSLSDRDRSAGYMLAAVLIWVSGFFLIFGQRAGRAAKFSLLLLSLAIPFSTPLLHEIVHLLQAGSAQIVAIIFNLLGVSYVRSGFVFDLGSFSIEVADECSGIRSSIAVLILALLAAHIYLRRFWKQIVFIAASLVIMIVKNGIRIATLTLLSIHVNPGFLSGRLHHQGGFVFFLCGLILLAPVLWLLTEKNAVNPQSSFSTNPN
jgi:exosortase